MMNEFEITQPYQNIYLVSTKTQYEIASMFMRMQEFYESPYENIRGQQFSLDEYMDTYAEDTGNFTYTVDWNGFNVPGEIAIKFWSLFHQDTRNKELAMRNEFLRVRGEPNIYGMKSNFYLIGVSGEADPYTMKHEVAHAMYYLDENYRNSMILAMNVTGHHNLYEGMHKKLKKMGYCDEVLMDETQAYMSTSSRWSLLKTFGFWAVPWEEVTNFRNLRAKLMIDYEV